MRKGFLAICAVLLLIIASIAVLGPSCNGTPTTGTIEVKATLDGAPWTGPVDYTLTGPGATAPTVINGTSVDDSFTADPGNWTCAYASGGPGLFVDITPSDTQSVTANTTSTFTLNFETPEEQVDAYVTFDSWSINGTPIPTPPPGVIVWVTPGTIIDATYKEGVTGNNTGQPVTVHETSWLTVHNTGQEGSGEGPVITLHVVNGLGAVTTDPPSDVSNQQATVEGVPKPVCYKFDLPVCQDVHLDAEADLEQEVGTNYTKTINWLRVPPGLVILVDNGVDDGAVVFDVDYIGDYQTFTLVSYACVEVGEGFKDTDPDNNCCVASSMITIGFQPAGGP